MLKAQKRIPSLWLMPREKLGKYWETAPRFSHADAVYAYPFYEKADMGTAASSHPGELAPGQGYLQAGKYPVEVESGGEQKGLFNIYVFRRQGFAQ